MMKLEKWVKREFNKNNHESHSHWFWLIKIENKLFPMSFSLTLKWKTSKKQTKQKHSFNVSSDVSSDWLLQRWWWSHTVVLPECVVAGELRRLKEDKIRHHVTWAAVIIVQTQPWPLDDITPHLLFTSLHLRRGSCPLTRWGSQVTVSPWTFSSAWAVEESNPKLNAVGLRFYS